MGKEIVKYEVENVNIGWIMKRLDIMGRIANFFLNDKGSKNMLQRHEKILLHF
jgi:hypothetical protein